MFGPLTKPEDEFLRLPPDVKVEVISELVDIPKLEVLIGASTIGVDSEWRPQVSKWQETKGMAVIQLSSATDAFVIDLINLKTCM